MALLHLISWQPLQFLDDHLIQLDPDVLGGGTEGVGDGAVVGRTVADEADSLDTQQWCPAERAVMEPLQQPFCRLCRLLPLGGEFADYLLIYQAHHELEQALGEFQDDVSGKAIGYDHVGGTAMDVATLDIADKAVLKWPVSEEIVGLADQLVPFAFFFADIHETDGRPLASQ